MFLSREKHQSNLKTHGKKADASYRLPLTIVFHHALSEEEQQKVKTWLQDHKVDILDLSSGYAQIVVDAPTANKMTQTELHVYQEEGETKKHHHGLLHDQECNVHDDLKPYVCGIVGLSTHSIAQPHCQKRELPADFDPSVPRVALIAAKEGEAKDDANDGGDEDDGNGDGDGDGKTDIQPRAGFYGISPARLAYDYEFPTSTSGAGQAIAYVELGGGYDLNAMKSYAKYIGIQEPTIVSVSVDGGYNNVNDQDASGEVCLDLCCGMGGAPAATHVVIFAENTDRSFLNAFIYVLNDTKYNARAISCSWGQNESGWSKSSMIAMNNVFGQLAAKGIAVFCSSGDNGYTDGVPGTTAWCDFPASAPNAVAVGGTTCTYTSDYSIKSETAWNSSGGGVSAIFPVPAYQLKYLNPLPKSLNPGNSTGRCVPDIASLANPNTGFVVNVNGVYELFGGTSAGSPLQAALFAKINAVKENKNYGLIHNYLYQSNATPAFVDITSGNNGYATKPGYDLVTGLGRLRGQKFLDILP